MCSLARSLGKPFCFMYYFFFTRNASKISNNRFLTLRYFFRVKKLLKFAGASRNEISAVRSFGLRAFQKCSSKNVILSCFCMAKFRLLFFTSFNYCPHQQERNVCWLGIGILFFDCFFFVTGKGFGTLRKVEKSIQVFKSRLKHSSFIQHKLIFAVLFGKT